MHKKLFNIARKIYREHALTPVAKKAFYEVIKNDQELMKLAVDFAIEEALDLTQREMRSIITRETSDSEEVVAANGENTHGGPRRYSKNRQQAVVAACGLYYQFPMMDGTALANAGREHILKDAERYAKNAYGNLFKRDFLRLVAHGMDKTQKVIDAYSEAELRHLADVARNKVNKRKKKEEQRPPEIA